MGILTWKGTYTSQNWCKHVGIWVNSSQARICASREHDLGRYQSREPDSQKFGLVSSRTDELSWNKRAQVFNFIFKVSSQNHRLSSRWICLVFRCLVMAGTQITIWLADYNLNTEVFEPKFQMVRYSNGRFMCSVLSTRWTIRITDHYIRKQDSVNLYCFQMVVWAVWFSNGIWIQDHLASNLFYHLNTELVRFTDPHCILFII